jgi:hypothetical protein
MCKLERKLSLI